MKFSKYNEFFTVNGNNYLYNIFSTALIEIDSELSIAISKNNVELIDSEFINDMHDMHFLVDDELDETLEYMHFFNTQKYGCGAKSLSIVFVPTYNCNLVCPYCMQGLSKKHEIITVESTNAILNFIESKIKSSKTHDIPISNLYVSLFGGEPLLAKPILKYFCSGVKKISQDNNCDVHFTMTSNCTLIDNEILHLIKDYNIEVQVSIDGTKEQHNRSVPSY